MSLTKRLVSFAVAAAVMVFGLSAAPATLQANASDPYWLEGETQGVDVPRNGSAQMTGDRENGYSHAYSEADGLIAVKTAETFANTSTIEWKNPKWTRPNEQYMVAGVSFAGPPAEAGGAPDLGFHVGVLIREVAGTGWTVNVFLPPALGGTGETLIAQGYELFAFGEEEGDNELNFAFMKDEATGNWYLKFNDKVYKTEIPGLNNYMNSHDQLYFMVGGQAGFGGNGIRVVPGQPVEPDPTDPGETADYWEISEGLACTGKADDGFTAVYNAENENARMTTKKAYSITDNVLHWDKLAMTRFRPNYSCIQLIAQGKTEPGVTLYIRDGATMLPASMRHGGYVFSIKPGDEKETFTQDPEDENAGEMDLEILLKTVWEVDSGSNEIGFIKTDGVWYLRVVTLDSNGNVTEAVSKVNSKVLNDFLNEHDTVHVRLGGSKGFGGQGIKVAAPEIKTELEGEVVNGWLVTDKDKTKIEGDAVNGYTIGLESLKGVAQYETPITDFENFNLHLTDVSSAGWAPALAFVKSKNAPVMPSESGMEYMIRFVRPGDTQLHVMFYYPEKVAQGEITVDFPTVLQYVETSERVQLSVVKDTDGHYYLSVNGQILRIPETEGEKATLINPYLQLDSYMNNDLGTHTGAYLRLINLGLEDGDEFHTKVEFMEPEVDKDESGERVSEFLTMLEDNLEAIGRGDRAAIKKMADAWAKLTMYEQLEIEGHLSNDEMALAALQTIKNYDPQADDVSSGSDPNPETGIGVPVGMLCAAAAALVLVVVMRRKRVYRFPRS